MTSFVTVCDVKSAEKRYACLRIVNNKTKMNKICVSSHRCLGSPVVRKKEFRLKGFISLEDLFVCFFVALRPKSTAMVIAGRSVHLTTLFPGQA